MLFVTRKASRTRKPRPERGLFRLRREIELPHSLESVFAFFADAFQLETITPPWLRFRVITPPPIVMRKGLHIDYRLRLHGLPLRWTSEITEWEPPHRFVDVQVRGPYRWWRHEHRFVSSGDTTRIVDEVKYAVTGGPLVHALLVRRDVERIFEFRAKTLRELWDPNRKAPQSGS
jgi:ligand-binding SRPBCC domain-containing protein